MKLITSNFKNFFLFFLFKYCISKQKKLINRIETKVPPLLHFSTFLHYVMPGTAEASPKQSATRSAKQTACLHCGGSEEKKKFVISIVLF
jgi:hypothetical protein